MNATEPAYSLADMALLAFVLVQAVNVAGLALDLVLYQLGGMTITETTKVCHAVGYVIVAFQLLGAAALAVHFFAR